MAKELYKKVRPTSNIGIDVIEPATPAQIQAARDEVCVARVERHGLDLRCGNCNRIIFGIYIYCAKCGDRLVFEEGK